MGEFNNDIFEVKKLKKIKPKTKNAKAAGVKSTFVVGDDVVMTSFGKGNRAILEKEIINGEVRDINSDIKFSVEPENERYAVKGNGRKSYAYTAQDSVNEVGSDLIGCKDALEQRYFGKTFNDNIHIQLIYNILDIEKILTIHINNIVYSLDNIERRSEAEYDDFVGYLSTRNSYDKFCEPYKSFTNETTAQNIDSLHKHFDEYKENPRLRYFDCIKYNGKKIDSEFLYYVLCMLGDVRQFCAHSKNVDMMYNLERELPNEAKEILDAMYKEKIVDINENFVGKNGRNIIILSKALNCASYQKKLELAKSFYDFAIRKKFKNIGFSIKKLREQIILNKDPQVIDDHRTYDSIRPKLYTLFDYIIYNYYSENEEAAKKNLDELRTFNKNEEKDKFYAKEADRLWTQIRSQYEAVKDNVLNVRNIEATDGENEVLKSAMDSVALGTETNYFCKLIYLMTRFMDGKEINDLLTTLISKFENIASFVDVMNERGIECKFKSNREINFSMFENSWDIAEDLRAINSFARMSSTDSKAKRILYVEAAEILGVSMSEEELIEYLDEKMLSKEIPKRKHDFRNFIASNVIESSRFRYLVRYANPKKVRAVVENKKVVSFVLGKMPDEQIKRYYESCIGKENLPPKHQQIEKLADIIGKMNLEQFENVKLKKTDEFQKIWEIKRQENDKMQKQAIISLYLTVLYILVKNLVYVNARYFLAFHCCERDMRLHDIKVDRKIEWCTLTQKFVAQKEEEINEWFNSLENPTANQSKRKRRILRSCSYLKDDIAHIDNKTIVAYRNNIDHLGPIRNIDLYINDAKNFKSYFELYHYLMQRAIVKCQDIEEYKSNHPKVQEYMQAVINIKTYCKDFVKALNAPFGYNLPRFKNLSIDALFDMHSEEYHQKEND